MCGRFALHTSLANLQRLFAFMNHPDTLPRWNVAPSQRILAVRTGGDGKREGVLLHWGLVPFWSRDLSSGPKSINARSETVHEKPLFNEPIRKRRCLVLADGFYEWGGTTKPKTPYYFTLKSGRPFALAGIWDHWKGNADSPPLDSCALLTTVANPLMAPVHDRMPVILPVEHHALWLDPKIEDPKELFPLFRPFPAEEMAVHAVGPEVNNPRNDWADLVKPAGG